MYPYQATRVAWMYLSSARWNLLPSNDVNPFLNGLVIRLDKTQNLPNGNNNRRALNLEIIVAE